MNRRCFGRRGASGKAYFWSIDSIPSRGFVLVDNYIPGITIVVAERPHTESQLVVLSTDGN